MILLIGNGTDKVIVSLKKYSDKLGIKCLLFDVTKDSLSGLNPNKFKSNNEIYHYSEFSGTFNRALKCDFFGEHNIYYQFTSYMLALKLINVVNSPQSNLLVFSKANQLYQLSKIQLKALRLPDTWFLSNTYLNLYSELRKKTLIYKSNSNIRSRTQLLDEARRNNFLSSPTLFQHRIRGDNIRVHVVEQSVFSVKIESDLLDYRYYKNTSKPDMKVIELPTKVMNDCIEVTRHFGLTFSGIDLIKTSSNNYYFLEINPMPAYSWFEESMSDIYITKALIKTLVK